MTWIGQKSNHPYFDIKYGINGRKERGVSIKIWKGRFFKCELKSHKALKICTFFAHWYGKQKET